MRPFFCVCILALAAAWSGCRTNDELCNKSIEKGERFEVEVVEQRDPATLALPHLLEDLPSCGLDDLQAGLRREVTLSEFHSVGGETGCQLAVCPADLPVLAPALDERLTEVNPFNVCAASDTKVQLGPQCELARYVAIFERYNRQALYPDQNGVVEPELIIVRALRQGGGQVTCSDLASRYPSAPQGNDFLCADTWQVRLTKR